MAAPTGWERGAMVPSGASRGRRERALRRFQIRCRRPQGRLWGGDQGSAAGALTRCSRGRESLNNSYLHMVGMTEEHSYLIVNWLYCSSEDDKFIFVAPILGSAWVDLC
uniref:Uncharacterized protein n=1 Tax=Triticum urartu TaxID=4572 RepID=A0A8R7K453_TRIUA